MDTKGGEEHEVALRRYKRITEKAIVCIGCHISCAIEEHYHFSCSKICFILFIPKPFDLKIFLILFF